MADSDRTSAGWAALAAPAAGALAGAAAGWLAGAPALSAALAAAGAALGALMVRGDGHSAPRGPAPRERAEPGGGALPAGYGRYLLDNIPLGVLLVDGKGRVQFVNRMAGSLFGGRPAVPFAAAVLRAPRLLEAIDRVLAGGDATTVTFSLARAGDTLLKARIEPVDGPGPGRDVLVVLEDHTDAHRAAELHRDFVANASHELKTPLAAVSGLIETLEGHARDDREATERFLRIMAAETARMTQLVKDLLSLNRIEINERIRPETPVRALRIAVEAAEALRGAADAQNMTLVLPDAPDHPVVRGDRDELHQLFTNLVENATRYGEPGTPVELRLREGTGVHAGRTGIAVVNQGAGIAREHIPRLTERFYRVSAKNSRAKGGTGLGLAICKHIVNRHGGELTIESEPGKGAAFTVWLTPVAAGPSRTTASEMAVAPQA